MCKVSFFDEPAAMWNESLQIATADTTCDMCHGPIVAHEQFALLEWSSHHEDVEDREIETEEYCLPCQAIRNEFFEAHGGDRTNGSVVPDLLRECVDYEVTYDEATDSHVPAGEGIRWQQALDEIAARRALVAT